MELMQANTQWRSRPDDERFTSLTEMHAAMVNNRINSAAKVISSRSIEAQPMKDNPFGLVIVGPNGNPVTPSNWAFGQLAGLADAPAGYLRDLPAPLAADCINYGLKIKRDVSDIGILLQRDGKGGTPILSAATGPNYGRVWNSVMTEALINRFGDGRTGDFRIPGEFGKQVEITKANTTLFAGDRDMFVFLADEEHRIDVPDRRNGQSGSMARGFFVWNSQVGKTTFGVATFLFDYVCANRIVWGASEFKEIRFRHTASAPDRFIDEVQPALLSYANSSARSITEGIAAAKQFRIDNVAEFLAKRFTKRETVAIMAAHISDEDRPIETLWDAATGATAYARGLGYQDERVKIERKAGEILDLVAA